VDVLPYFIYFKEDLESRFAQIDFKSCCSEDQSTSFSTFKIQASRLQLPTESYPTHLSQISISPHFWPSTIQQHHPPASMALIKTLSLLIRGTVNPGVIAGTAVVTAEDEKNEKNATPRGRIIAIVVSVVICGSPSSLPLPLPLFLSPKYTTNTSQ